jgi:hypothetical protein
MKQLLVHSSEDQSINLHIESRIAIDNMTNRVQSDAYSDSAEYVRSNEIESSALIVDSLR